jgi:hypothetical protein
MSAVKGLRLTPDQHRAVASLSALHADRPLRLDSLAAPGRTGEVIATFGTSESKTTVIPIERAA